jgi:hypothetical protein
LSQPGLRSHVAGIHSSGTTSDCLLRRIRWAVAAAVAALGVLGIVRLSFVTGLRRRVTIDGPSMAPAFCGAHHELPCGDCGFEFRCDAEHVPPDRRAVCPNCGYADNSLETAPPLPADRVLIDGWPLLWGQPQRGETMAIQVPPENGELAVKRLAAWPHEQLAIRDGNLYDDERIIRKTLSQLHAVRLLVHDNDFQPRKTSGLPPRWRGASENSHWNEAGTGFRIEPSVAAVTTYDWLQYEHWPCTADQRLRGVGTPIMDNDSYNQGETNRPLNAVSDAMLSCRLRAVGTGRFALAASDGDVQFEVEIEPRKRVVLRSRGQRLVDRLLSTDFSRRAIKVEFGLCDQQVLLAIGGRTVLRFDYERPAGSRPEVLEPLAIGAAGMGLDISQLRVWRDVHYLDPQGLPRPWKASGPLAPDEFAMLGDNQPVSIDSRHWEEAGVPRRALVGHVYRPFWMAQ